MRIHVNRSFFPFGVFIAYFGQSTQVVSEQSPTLFRTKYHSISVKVPTFSQGKISIENDSPLREQSLQYEMHVSNKQGQFNG
jgi:hypothetical protein